MAITLHSGSTTAIISEVGAELISLAHNGLEYIWQGAPGLWGGRSPNLFPYVARLTEGKYSYCGKEYLMDQHGFAKDSVFMESHQQQGAVFTLKYSDSSLKCYPFKHVFSVGYELDGNRLKIEYTVENKENCPMYFGIGGHPGFNVPMDHWLGFSDYYIEFKTGCSPSAIEFSDKLLVKGESEFPLEGGKKLSLSHSLFDNDALVLRNISKEITLKSDKSERSVKMGFPNMDYLGIWHTPKTNAPFVCLEPWASLPSRDGVIENLELQPSLIKLDESQIYRNGWWIEIA